MMIRPRAGWSPRFSPSGQWCAYQSSQVEDPHHPTVRLVVLGSGEERTLAPIGNEVAAYPAGWYNEWQVLYIASLREDHKGPYTLRAIDVPSGANYIVATLPSSWLDGVRVVAANGHWAAACGTTVMVDGVIWSEHLHWRIAWDGHLLAVPTSQGIEVWQMAGGVGMPRSIYLVASGAIAMDINVCDPYLGYGYGQCRLIDMQTGTDVDAQINPRPERESAPQVVGGWVWSFREKPTPMVMGRPIGETACIQVPVPESCVYLHVVKRGSDWLIATNGDQGQTYIQSVSVDAERKPLVNVPSVPAPEPVPDYPRLQYPALIGAYFVGTYRWPSTLENSNGCKDVFGNCAVVVGESVAAQTLDPCIDGQVRYRIIDPSTIPVMADSLEHWATVAAISIAAEGTADPVASVRRLRQWSRYTMDFFGVPRKPIIIYLAADLDGLRRVASDDLETWPAVQLYLEPGQGPDDLRRLAARSFEALGSLPVVQVAQAYDRNGTYAGDVSALVPVYHELAAQLGPRHKGTLAFSYKRKGGIVDLVTSGKFPTLHAQWIAFGNAVPRP
jgi:hypothetical protein